MQQSAPPSAPPQDSAPMDDPTMAELSGMEKADQMQHLGEKLFPKITNELLRNYNTDQAEKLAAKITGMFLEMDMQSLLYLLETPLELRQKIDEALQVLREHGAMPPGCQQAQQQRSARVLVASVDAFLMFVLVGEWNFACKRARVRAVVRWPAI
eukprot:TRINITY_DN1241_c0_g1_i1.p3 TRINITY_DN1241_c0_g1~~TRINITY_DN1241_c0_g1_i1.p3  ORF type:complete len:162 (-),score=29.61 TRINITY_DN1241_c0_g1_i1:345-809(-)